MSNADRATNEATQKPATVAVAASGRASRAVAPTELEIPADGAVVPVQAEPATVTLPRALLTEALTVLTIYAEVAVPVVNYRGQPLSAHAPRELVERIHRAIGA
jgi:hypothetical protein